MTDNSKKSVLERARTHLKNLNANLLGPIEVPEWGDEDGPLKIYTRYLSSKVENRLAIFENKKRYDEFLMMSVILRALDEDGNNIFKEGDLSVMVREVSPQVATRVLHELARLTNLSEDDLKTKK